MHGIKLFFKSSLQILTRTILVLSKCNWTCNLCSLREIKKSFTSI